MQRQNGSTWTTVVTGDTAENGVYSTVLTGQSAGTTQHFRAGVGPDADNGVRIGYSATVGVVDRRLRHADHRTHHPRRTPRPPADPGAPRAGDVRFSLVQYNPPGTDKANNAGYNRGVLPDHQLHDQDDQPEVLDREGPGRQHLPVQQGLPACAARASIYVLTGKGTDGKPANYRYWGEKGYIWNNTGDAAYLRTGSNKQIDSCSWGNGNGKTSC